MVAIVQLALRGTQLFLTLLITALIGNVIAQAIAGNPPAINFAIFVAVLSWIASLFGCVAAVVESVAIPLVLISLDALATFFTFIAGVVLAAKLGVHSCANKTYVVDNSLTNGSDQPSKRCHELQASTAFFWFLFAAYVVSLLMTIMSGRSSGMSSRGGIRKGAPTMSQV